MEGYRWWRRHYSSSRLGDFDVGAMEGRVSPPSVVWITAGRIVDVISIEVVYKC